MLLCPQQERVAVTLEPVFLGDGQFSGCQLPVPLPTLEVVWCKTRERVPISVLKNMDRILTPWWLDLRAANAIKTMMKTHDVLVPAGDLHLILLSFQP